MAKLSKAKKVIIGLVLVGVIGWSAVIITFLVRKHAQDTLRDERRPIMEAIERAALLRCEASGRWPITNAGPVGPGYSASFADDEQFARLHLQVEPGENYIYLTNFRPFLGNLLIYAVSVRGNGDDDRYHVRKCVIERRSGGELDCRCRWPLVTGAPRFPTSPP